MEDEKVILAKQTFELEKRFSAEGLEYWSARSLSKLLGYSEYRHFLSVVEKAKKSAKNSDQSIKNHFEDVLDMIELGKNASRQISDIK